MDYSIEIIRAGVNRLDVPRAFCNGFHGVETNDVSYILLTTSVVCVFIYKYTHLLGMTTSGFIRERAVVWNIFVSVNRSRRDVLIVERVHFEL